MKQVKAIIIGAGNRGQGYATYAEDFPQYLKLSQIEELRSNLFVGELEIRIKLIVGVCDPLEIRRKRLQEIHNIPDDRVFCDWSDVVKVDKFADAVIVTTPDQFHKAPSVACADKGYHVLLEKPMAISADDCCAIAAACKRNNVMLVVCHVLRYAGWVKKIKELIDSGVIGDVVNIQHTEPPEGAGMKCMDCKVEKNCPYSAKKLYLEGVSK
uniref:Uncharacterized protein LOC102808858 n=1 Tax=Saccoglossus kowalevskii TaxID=10224 RepID=A0ABM0MZR7_SACKO